MNQIADVWFIRLPSGRVLRAPSTRAVRRHLNRGRIPSNSQGRRAPEEAWRGLDSIAEFADLTRMLPGNGHAAPGPPTESGSSPREAGTIASRLDPLQMRTIGVGRSFQELLAALDSTLVPSKLLIAAGAGLLAGLLFAGQTSGVLDMLMPNAAERWVVLAVVLLAAAAVTGALLTKMTYLEVSRLRPARWKRSRAGLLPNTLRLAFLYLVTGGLALAAIIGLRVLPAWLLNGAGWDWPADIREAIGMGAAVTAVVLEVALWPVVAFSLLLGPVLIIEECSVPAALAGWCRLLRHHFARLFLGEALAVCVGSAAAAALALPLFLAAMPGDRFGYPLGLAFWVLGGVAATPLIAYLAVANVFLYLDVRYRQESLR
jgi:hypothetical protein